MTVGVALRGHPFHGIMRVRTTGGHGGPPLQLRRLTSGGSIRKFKFLLLGGRPMVGLQTLDLAIGVRVPASQPHRFKHLRAA